MGSDSGNGDISPRWQLGDPPAPGHYLVTVEVNVFDDGKTSRSVNLARWDGEWKNLGGYVRPISWSHVPPPDMRP